MEILGKNKYGKFEEFCLQNAGTPFEQSPRWTKVKKEWDSEVIVSRDEDGRIAGGMTVLIRKLGLKSLMYACHGPVCDLSRADILKDLLTGVEIIAKKYKAYQFIMDPPVHADDDKTITNIVDAGLRFTPHESFGLTIQPRYSYISTRICDCSADKIPDKMSRSTRRKMKYGEKRGLVCRPEGKNGLDDFYRLYEATGERKKFAIRGKEYFERLLDAFGKDCRLYIARFDGEPLRGAIGINYAKTLSYVYGASVPVHKNLMPSYLVQRRLMEWAADEKCRIYDLMGVAPSPEDDEELYGVLKFKENFPGKIVEYAGEFKIIYDPFYNDVADFAQKHKLKYI